MSLDIEKMTISSGDPPVTLTRDDLPAFSDEKMPIIIPSKHDFLNEDGLTVDYLDAPDLGGEANLLINKHDRFGMLAGISIAYLWKKEGGLSKGKKRLGQTQKATNLLGYFSEVDVVIWLAADHIREHESGIASRKKIEACLFHELCHVLVDLDDAGERKVSLAPHDFEGFEAEVTEYQAWRSDLEVARKAFQQLGLFKRNVGRHV